MVSTLRSEIILRLSDYRDTGSEWHKPDSIIHHVSKLTRRAINKTLNELQNRGIVDRKYLKPKGRNKWESLSEKQKSRIARNSEWRIRHTKKAIVGAFKLLWDDGVKGSQFSKDFLESDYCNKNQDLLFYLLQKTFFLGMRRPNFKRIYPNIKELRNTISNNDKKIIELGLKSPTFMGVIFDGKRSDALAKWFIDNRSPNLLYYMKFVVSACLVVDSFSNIGELPPDVEQILNFLSIELSSQNVKMSNSTPLQEVARLSKPVKSKQEGGRWLKRTPNYT